MNKKIWLQPVYASLAAWLERHNLLTDAEREILPPDAFESVACVLMNRLSANHLAVSA